MITHKQISTSAVMVYLQGKHVGAIYRDQNGWCYRSKGSSTFGDYYPTLDACKASLEEK